MTKYVLMNQRTSAQFSTTDRQQLEAKVRYLEAEGIDLDEFIITVIDTDNFPPRSLPAAAIITNAFAVR